MSSNPPPRLPGFLRRSLRNPYDLNVTAPSPTSNKADTNGVTDADATSFDAKTLSASALPNKSPSSGGVPILKDLREGVSNFVRPNRNMANNKNTNPAVSAANNDSELFPRQRNASNASSEASSDADEHIPKDGQLYVAFPDDLADDNRRHSKSLPIEEGHGSSANASQQDSSLNKKALTYKESAFEKIIHAPIVNLRDLRKMAWNGIPTQYRTDSWRILLGYLPANASRRKATLLRKRADYSDAITQHYNIDDAMRTLQEQETLRQVLVDVPRTAPDVGLFRDERVRRCLERILYIWAMRHPASSYVQGINDLVTPLFAVFLSGYFEGVNVLDGKILRERRRMDKQETEGVENEQLDDWLVPESMLSEVEADCYWCLTKLLAGIQDHYTCDQPGVQRMVGRLEELVRRIDTNLWQYLKNMGIEFMQFAFKWMNCLLLREFSLSCVIRLWDTYLSEGDGGFEDFHVYVCAAFLCQFSAEVQTMEFDELFGFMQNMPTEEWGYKEVEVLLSQAFVLSTLFGGSDAHLTTARS